MFNDPFLNILPRLDVHGEIEDTVMVKVNDFILDNYKLYKDKILVIHGKGEQILRKKIHQDLKKNKLVSSFYLCNTNDGCTIIELKRKGE